MLTRTVYLLVLLIEECAEVIHRACKAIRFGLKEVQSSNADERRNNEQRLHEELVDLETVVNIMQEEKILPRTGLREHALQKRAKIEKYYEYSVQQFIAERRKENK